ncbi:RecQ family ATP-dependent DNA helicase [Vibrio alginolyticus]|uniref:RecQ family ATP-dependent DNA helicase n=1 Tax=Vibrio alginolyticus TaxID=663 RepID=UPI00215FD4C6|nr:DEAD/DEAH box helicase [Vibrio alginolyticus]ELB2905522.1 RecQ family ATP-dependent DNA helicase [Vibrio alginolyticus]MCS0278874.1 DEAD/DEAH box helicase [Vibrio alginolyticus]
MDKQVAEQLLKTAIGDEDAQFRDGQWEAIDALVNHNQKLLVVQRTGWGKSSVYFISTKIFRDRGQGPTIIVSPLLALMRNQIESAERLGLNAVRWDSTNRDERPAILHALRNNEIDALLIHPKQFSNEVFREQVLEPISDYVGLMVVDEAHCISDWGHDFIPEYRQIANILSSLPANTGVLGTTATANNRVVNDIHRQLGDIQIQRGELGRDSLSLQNISLPDQASRLAWLSQIIPQLDGTGIIYTLTTRDAEQVTEWLVRNDINARAYHGKVTHPDFVSPTGSLDTNQYRQHLEDLLLNNQIDVLVATMALGMGYDKPDLSFVIHYQSPGSIVAYYQQVGRAGRGIDNAVGILLSGREDADIHEYFRSSAFPSLEQINEILNELAPVDGLTMRQLEERTNLRFGQIEKVLKLLSVENPAPVVKEGSQWKRTSARFNLDQDRIEHLTQQRELEWQEVLDYQVSDSCLMLYLRQALDDEEAQPCGRCAVCLEQEIVSGAINPSLAHDAGIFLRHAEMPIKPNVQVAAGAFVEEGFRGNLPLELRAQEGRVLSRWGDAGWGQMVRDDKHENHFRNELVDAMAEMILERWELEERPTWLCCVPSRNHPELVPDYARRLAERLGLEFVDVIQKVRDNEQQKFQQNRFHQCRNLDGAFEVQESIPEGPCFLVDDIVDSGWTLTVIAAKLQQAGSGKVYPVALASTSVND